MTGLDGYSGEGEPEPEEPEEPEELGAAPKEPFWKLSPLR